MKTWLISIFGLIIFISLSIYIQHQIESTTHYLDLEMGRIERTLLKKDWDQTLVELSKVQKKWGRTKPFWAIILHHQEIDSIDQALIKTISALKSRDYPQTQIELSSLQHFIQHIPERERFSLVNVL